MNPMHAAMNPDPMAASMAMLREPVAVVTDAQKQALELRVIAEIAALDNVISSLRSQHGVEAEDGITHLQASQALLLTSLREVQHAKHPRELRQVAAHVDTAIRHSTESRCSASHGQETTVITAKTIAKTLAAPFAGSVSKAFAGKTLSLTDYRSALSSIARQGQQMMDGFRAHIEAATAAAAQHSVDIGRSLQLQQQLLQQAGEAYVQGQPAEATSRVSEAATLGLRDAERVRGVHRDAQTEALVERARSNAREAVRLTADQMQLDARRECTEQGKTGEALEACTVQGATARIDTLRLRMIRIQVQVGETEDAADARATSILREAAPHDQPAIVLGQARAEQQARNASTVVRMTVTDVNVTQIRITPAETPQQTVTAPHVMGPR